MALAAIGRRGIYKMTAAAKSSADLFKGTTARDVYDKVKVVFREGTQTQAERGTKRGESSQRHRHEGADPRRSVLHLLGDRGVGYAEQPELVCVAQDSDAAASSAAEPCRRIVVTRRLPLRAEPNPQAPHGLDFSLDDDALALQLCRGLPRPVVFVGTLPSVAGLIPASEDLAADLLARFSCWPVFLPPDNFYDAFCEKYLMPMLHSLHPLTPSSSGYIGYSADLYSAYLAANSRFADRVFELLNPDEDLVFIHDYHLWALPTILRCKSLRASIGFFLYSTFPTLEIFRAIPFREDLLRALLNADLVGFQSYEHLRHFLSCCIKFLGVSHHFLQGQIIVSYLGRAVAMKALSFCVDIGKLREFLSSQETVAKALDIREKYAQQQVLLAVDEDDVDKGAFMLLAMEKLLELQPELRGQVVLVHMNNKSEQSSGRTEILEIRDRISGRFSLPRYDPVVVMDGPLLMQDRMAFYIVAEVCIIASVREGLNRTPDIYTLCRQDSPIVPRNSPRHSCIIVSEFVRYSPSLSCAIRVNQWTLNDVTEAMSSAVGMNKHGCRTGHNMHCMYLKSHDAAHWSSLIDQDLQRACKDRASMNILSVGLGMNFQLVALGPDCKKLLPEHIKPSYLRTVNRLILLDYDCSVTPQGLIFRAPNHDLIDALTALCSDAKNTVFVVSGQGKIALAEWFAPCQNLGILAEHGYFRRWPWGTTWEEHSKIKNLHSINMIRLVMKQFTDATDGSYTEVKESALVWHYEEADPDIAASQAKELQEVLLNLNLNVLAKEPMYVQNRHQTVEVIPPGGVGKGIAIQSMIAAMKDQGRISDFILYVGDDRSDIDVFEAIAVSSYTAEVFDCTVGRNPNLAKYYLGDFTDAVKLLQGLAMDN